VTEGGETQMFHKMNSGLDTCMGIFPQESHGKLWDEGLIICGKVAGWEYHFQENLWGWIQNAGHTAVAGGTSLSSTSHNLIFIIFWLQNPQFQSKHHGLLATGA
jgi:hypothetical protein